MTQQGFVNMFGVVAVATMLSTAPAIARDGQHARRAHATQPHTRDTEVQRTDTGHTRTDTVTRADGATATGAKGETATRDLTVAQDKEAGTTTRSANYTTADGRSGSMSDVIQRTDDGYTRDTTRTLPNGETHTRDVDVSCDKDAAKCVKQVETGHQP